MRFSYPLQLTPAQFADLTLARASLARPPRLFRWAASAGVIALFAAIGALLMASYGHATVRANWVWTPALVALGACVALFSLSRAGTRLVLRRTTHSTQPRTLLVEEEGLRIRGPAHDLFHGWPDISRVEDDGAAVYFMLDDLHFYALPYAMFESTAEKDEFVAHVRGRLGAKQVAVETMAASAPKTPGRQRNLRPLMNDAIRLVLFMKVAPGRMEQSWATILALVLLGVLIPALPALLATGLDAEWSWYSMPGALVHIPLLLAAAIAAAYATRGPGTAAGIFCAGLLAALTIDILAMLFAAAGSDIPNFQRFAYAWHWFPGAWLALALATYASRLIPRGERRLAVVMACVVLLAVPLANIYRDRALWHPPYDAEAAEEKSAKNAVAGEDAFYRQPALLAQELEGVRAGRKGRVDVFFVGMAGFGGQDVFMREIDSVAKMFRERFGAEGHVVRLVNNPKRLLDTPIASRTSLAAALKRVAQVMDKDEDVLVLFMTSHGSENHRFSLSLWPLQFHEIDPATLRSLLDEAGIRYRVVVVSACYSGGFVKPLEGPDTLVITASAADRNSFGCSNEADWTYFGKAYFDDALRKTHSFVKAFEIAKPAIAAREVKEKFDSSQPQMSLGAGIAAKLGELEAELDAGR